MLLLPRQVRNTIYGITSNLLCSPGTAGFGILDVPLPQGTVLVNQVLWGSIGWSVGRHPIIGGSRMSLTGKLGSCLGAALAAKDKGLQRTILFVGDGSL